MKMAGEKRHVVDFLFTLALFCVFAASALLVVIMGANVYKSTVNTMTDNYENRTSLTYIAEKIRQNDTPGSVVISTVEDSPALVLRQQVGDREYQTWIYVYDGNLKEILIASDATLNPESGQTVKEQQSLALEQNGSLLTVTTTDPAGKSESITLHVRCGS